MSLDDLKHAQRERLQFLDQCFAWKGQANRRDLIDRFGVSAPQAALDFKAYLERAIATPPTYDSARKTYLAADNHVSLSPETLYRDWAQIIAKANSEIYEELPRLNRLSEPQIMSHLFRAMDQGLSIHVKYTSMTTGKDSGQWIAPTRFASDGERVHVRAYSFKHDQYRDYVPVRFSQDSSFETRAIHPPLPEDEEWETLARIYLVPKSTLSEEQAQAVRREYGFDSRTLCIETRKALEFYADRRWGLDQTNARLERYKTEYRRAR